MRRTRYQNDITIPNELNHVSHRGQPCNLGPLSLSMEENTLLRYSTPECTETGNNVESY